MNEVADALKQLMIPDPSPSLTVLRKMTAEKESFTITHEPSKCPDAPPKPDKVAAGRRAHVIETLTDLKAYINHIAAGTSAIAFYTPASVAVVLDEKSEEEKEVVECSLTRSLEFEIWQRFLRKPMPHTAFLSLLRSHTNAIANAAQNQSDAATLIGIFASLRGSLVHDAEDFLDTQHAAATFTVKRKAPGSAGESETQVENVPTEFYISLAILPDDEELTNFTVSVRMTGAPGAAIEFMLFIDNLDQAVESHIESRLEEFSIEAGFLCVRGKFEEEPWSEPTLPASIKELMEEQTKLIKAMAQPRGSN